MATGCTTEDIQAMPRRESYDNVKKQREKSQFTVFPKQTKQVERCETLSNMFEKPTSKDQSDTASNLKIQDKILPFSQATPIQQQAEITFTCRFCGKECKSEGGRTYHLKFCKKNNTTQHTATAPRSVQVEMTPSMPENREPAV